MSIEVLVDAIIDAIDETQNIYPLVNGEILAALELMKFNTLMEMREEDEQKGQDND